MKNTMWYHLFVKLKKKKPNSQKQPVECWLPGAGVWGIGEMLFKGTNF